MDIQLLMHLQKLGKNADEIRFARDDAHLMTTFSALDALDRLDVLFERDKKQSATAK